MTKNERDNLCLGDRVKHAPEGVVGSVTQVKPIPVVTQAEEGMTIDKVIDELCECGHNRSEHSTEGHVEKGHGACHKCGCSQFTWFDFVFEE